jgi:hypothetical protein
LRLMKGSEEARVLIKGVLADSPEGVSAKRNF